MLLQQGVKGYAAAAGALNASARRCLKVRQRHGIRRLPARVAAYRVCFPPVNGSVLTRTWCSTPPSRRHACAVALPRRRSTKRAKPRQAATEHRHWRRRFVGCRRFLIDGDGSRFVGVCICCWRGCAGREQRQETPHIKYSSILQN